MTRLSFAEARRLAVARQLLDGPHPRSISRLSSGSGACRSASDYGIHHKTMRRYPRGEYARSNYVHAYAKPT